MGLPKVFLASSRSLFCNTRLGNHGRVDHEFSQNHLGNQTISVHFKGGLPKCSPVPRKMYSVRPKLQLKKEDRNITLEFYKLDIIVLFSPLECSP